MRFRLRTLLIVLALGPPLLAGLWLAPGYLQADELGWCLFALVHGFLGYVATVALAAWFSRRRANGKEPPHAPLHDPRRAVVDGGGGAGDGIVD